jgi:hypothetical protein
MVARFLALGAVVAASAGALLLSCDLTPDTNYGPHSGLSKANLPTPPAGEGGSGDGGVSCGTPVDAGPCSVSYTNDIWPKMQSTWHCSDAKCHGGTTYQPQLDSADNAYDNMMAYKVGGTKPYINPCSTDADASAFVCNISSTFCGTAQMPFPDSTLGSGPMSGADQGLVTTWVQCGAPKN